MATTVEHMTEVAMKLKLTKQASEKLLQRASKIGQDVSAVASGLIEQAVTQSSFQEAIVSPPREAEVAETGDTDGLDLAEEVLNYNPVPPRRSYTVQAVVVERRRGVPIPSNWTPSNGPLLAGSDCWRTWSGGHDSRLCGSRHPFRF